MIEPVAPDVARKLIRQILQTGLFTYSRHAIEEMLADDLTTISSRSHHDRLRDRAAGGVVRPREFEREPWRYRVETSRTTVVITFRSESELVVVTAWRAAR